MPIPENLRCQLTTLLVLGMLSGCATVTSKPVNEASSPGNGGTTYIRAGSQSPAVVLQAGLSDGKQVWSNVISHLSRDHTVIAFDRPGRAASPSTDAPRDPCTIASEQRALLRSAGVKPPYILVGHSLGGIYQYAFAKLYPADVAGIVLVDPTPPNHWETMQKEAPAAATIIKAMRAVAFSSTDRREFDDQAKCLETLNMTTPLTLPARILVAGRFTRTGESGDFEKMMKQSRQQWLRLIHVPKLEVIWDSGHYIQTESPEDVIAAVQQVTVETSRKR